MKTRMKKHPSLAIILQVVRRHLLLFLGIFLLILGAIVCSLLPPLVLEKIVDRLAGGYGIPVSLAALYFNLLKISRTYFQVLRTLSTFMDSFGVWISSISGPKDTQSSPGSFPANRPHSTPA